MLKSFYFLCVLFPLTVTACFAGSGLYFGADTITNELHTHVAVKQTFSSPPPEDINVANSATKTFLNLGGRIGYKYKRRLDHRFFISPELMVSQLDNDIIYGTNLKTGFDISDFSMYVTGGISHIEQFDKNPFNYGLGVAYKLSRLININLEWQTFDTLDENTLAIENFGAQILTTTTATRRDITMIKLGITIYLHE
ncbi:MAG TPA: hypothetical protein ENJ87_12800 [Gammaproteobacteria bacterium]|nr:hypothetical protein [Gammaproteobacteria bacterium]